MLALFSVVAFLSRANVRRLVGAVCSVLVFTALSAPIDELGARAGLWTYPTCVSPAHPPLACTWVKRSSSSEHSRSSVGACSVASVRAALRASWWSCAASARCATSRSLQRCPTFCGLVHCRRPSWPMSRRERSWSSSRSSSRVWSRAPPALTHCELRHPNRDRLTPVPHPVLGERPLPKPDHDVRREVRQRDVCLRGQRQVDPLLAVRAVLRRVRLGSLLRSSATSFIATSRSATEPAARDLASACLVMRSSMCA